MPVTASRNAAPAEAAFDITPHNTNELENYTRGIYVGTAGALKVDMVSGDTVTFTNIAAGVIHPIRARRVYATGTTASGLIGVY